MLEKINDDLELIKFDGVSCTTVYSGGLNELIKADLKWNKIHGDYAKALCIEMSGINLAKFAVMHKTNI